MFAAFLTCACLVSARWRKRFQSFVEAFVDAALAILPARVELTRSSLVVMLDAVGRLMGCCARFKLGSVEVKDQRSNSSSKRQEPQSNLSSCKFCRNTALHRLVKCAGVWLRGLSGHYF